MRNIQPRLTCLVVFGQDINADTASMIGAFILLAEVKNVPLETKITFLGPYAQTLPKKALMAEPCLDIVF